MATGRIRRPSAGAEAVKKTQAQIRAQKRAQAAEDQEGIRDIEFSRTVEVKHHRKGSTWIKGGATITPREGELPEDARARLIAFVDEGLTEAVQEWMS